MENCFNFLLISFRVKKVFHTTLILIHSETWEIWTLLLIGEICVSGKSVYQGNLCIGEICVTGKSVYLGNLCIWEICVTGKSVYRGNLCIGEICVPGKYVYRGNMCIGEICVSGKYVYRGNMWIVLHLQFYIKRNFGTLKISLADFWLV